MKNKNKNKNMTIKRTDEMESNTISFNLDKKEPIITLKDNGDILIKGKLAENDKEVVDAMREFLKTSGFIK